MDKIYNKYSLYAYLKSYSHIIFTFIIYDCYHKNLHMVYYAIVYYQVMYVYYSL